MGPSTLKVIIPMHSSSSSGPTAWDAPHRKLSRQQPMKRRGTWKAGRKRSPGAKGPGPNPARAPQPKHIPTQREKTDYVLERQRPRPSKKQRAASKAAAAKRTGSQPPPIPPPPRRVLVSSQRERSRGRETGAPSVMGLVLQGVKAFRFKRV